MPFGSIDDKIANCDSEITKILTINFFACAFVFAGRTDCALVSIVLQCLIHGVDSILVMCLATHACCVRVIIITRLMLKAKFHYAIWFEACRRPASNQLRTR